MALLVTACGVVHLTFRETDVEFTQIGDQFQRIFANNVALYQVGGRFTINSSNNSVLNGYKTDLSATQNQIKSRGVLAQILYYERNPRFITTPHKPKNNQKDWWQKRNHSQSK